MKHTAIYFSLLLTYLIFSGANAAAPTPRLLQSLDLTRHYQNALRADEAIELSSTTERFVGLQIEQRLATPQGGLLILHDNGQTADWPYLLQQVRTYMPDVGWTTLAIDLPIPSDMSLGIMPLDDEELILADNNQEAQDNRVLERIAAGIAMLNNNGLFNIVILGYGEGAYWGSRYLAERLTEEEKIGYGLILYEPTLQRDELADYVAELQISTLDLYMNNSDYAHRQAKNRKAAAMRAEHPDYLQIHDALRQSSYGKSDIDRSTRRVWGWLKTHAAGNEADLVEEGVF